MNNIVKNIMCLINNSGYEVYIVGGFVRDYLLNINSNDYDLCTNANTNELEKILVDYKYKIELCTVKIAVDDINIEITPYRKELKYCNRRLIEYELIDNLEEDLYRRDFTINAICMDLNENIIDILGGKKDLENRIIRGIGNNDKKINEDPLRMIRAFRFSSVLNFDIDNYFMNSILENIELLKDISYEKKKIEIDKIIDVKRLDILKPVSVYLDIDLSNIRYYTSKILTWMNIDTMNKYCVSNNEKKLINNVKSLCLEGITNYNLYRYGKEISYLVDELYDIDIVDKYTNLPIHSRSDIDITSKDIIDNIIDIKYTEEVYKYIENSIINGDIKNAYEDILIYIRKSRFKK